MADGSRKAIEDIKPGDEVLATDPGTGETVPRFVVATIIGDGLKHLVNITIDTDGPTGNNAETLTATDGHPFWEVIGHTWTTAGALKPGDEILSPDGTVRTVISASHYEVVGRVHNLSVAVIRTYYVLAGNTPVLVHNADGGEPYERRKHYGRTPTPADRKAFGAGPGQVVDHDPPLVKRYYEGDPNIGEKPGMSMTKAERRASANDRSRMGLQDSTDSNRQGRQMQGYSKQMKEEFFGGDVCEF
jgi:hypothetical protein